jgi:hypothetical protein
MKSDYQSGIDVLKNRGFDVKPGFEEVFGGAIVISLNGVAVELQLHYAKALADWILGTAQGVNNKIKD